MNDEIARWRIQATHLHRAGQFDAAEQVYNQILAHDGADPQARHMMGVLRLQQGRAAEALEIVTALAADVPGSADVRTHRGLALHELGRHGEALADFGQALAIKADHPLALLYRGNLLLAMGRPAEALADYDRVLADAPGNAEAWFRRGNALWRMDRAEDAASSFDKAVIADPAHFGSLFNLGTTLMRLERFDEALAVYERGRVQAPANRHLLGSAAGAVIGGCDLGRWEEYRDLVTQAVQQCRAVIAPLTLLAFSDDAALQRVASESFVEDRVLRHDANDKSPLWTGQVYGHDRVRIAYLSGDFRRHATADLLAGLIERHDRVRFEVTAISFGRDDGSPMRRRLMKAFDRFIDIREKTDAEAARMLHDAQIDIAVDLKGHTDDSRPGILSYRPCPVQVDYLGYPGTIGAPWLDYILADTIVLPIAQQPFYSEKIVHLPHCYQVNDSKRPIGDTPDRAAAGLPQNGFVFCCFNAAWKIAPPIFDIWMRLLRAMPASVLWLLEDNLAAVAHLKAAAAARNIDPARLVFAPRALSASHLARHRLADLFLDTLPYNAHTTASDALWAGLPVLTSTGSTFPGRVAASLLTAVGLPELITHTLEDYESRALALARDPARLAMLRERLAANRLTSPLFNTDLFRRHIEAAYMRMIEAAQRGEAPQGFAVPP